MIAPGKNSPPEPAPAPRRVAFLGTYPPRRCGIATFTQDLRMAAVAGVGPDDCPVIAMHDPSEALDYPPEVVQLINAPDIASYAQAAEFLNRSAIDLLCVQHEFGIHGGSAGGHLLALLRAVRMPIVTTLHTILRDPSPEQRRVIEALIQVSGRLIVMTERSREMLREVYGAPTERIVVIPHGIHDVAFEEPERCKTLLGLAERRVLLTFGLLSPNKGIEHVIQALPAITREFPTAVYLVLGATHPSWVREHGEGYRLGLERLAREIGVAEHVVFYDRFVALPELQDFIGAADVYVTPYLNERQVVSGTLAYAFGAGKAVVSTPYWHAAELLAEGRGALVPFADAAAIAREIGGLLGDDARRLAVRKRAYAVGRRMTWEHVQGAYRAAFTAAATDHATTPRQTLLGRTLAQAPLRLPDLRAAHVLRLTDAVGIWQHALYSIPNYAHGYCTDDNARALVLALCWEELEEGAAALRPLTNTYLAFLNYALHPDSGRFRNFMSFDRRWLEDAGSEDSHGRAVWALGVAAARAHDAGHRALAGELLLAALPAVEALGHPRTWSFVLLGLDAYLSRHPTNERVGGLRATLVARLMDRFSAHARDEWDWLADDATYDNARLPHALILAGRATDDAAVLGAGLRALRWLWRIQTSPTGTFQPIGSDGFFHRNGTRARFDQQPVEVAAMVSACLAAFRVTGDEEWRARAQQVFEWFLGRNDLGLTLYDAKTGGCRDALHADRVNENQGAESTLAFHLALAELRLASAAAAVTARRGIQVEVKGGGG